MLGVTDVVDVANQRAVAVSEDRELRCGIGEAWVEPDVVHIERVKVGRSTIVRRW